MAAFAFLSLDDDAYPEWQVRVDTIAAFRPDGDGVEVVLSSGVKVQGSLSVPALMARTQAAIGRMDDGA